MSRELQPLQSFKISEMYSNEYIYTTLGVGNAGGIRLKKNDGLIDKMVVMTSLSSAKQLCENPYHDRIENDILVYTAAGREGDQTLAGTNSCLARQINHPFPIYGFMIVNSRRDKNTGSNRWKFLGLLEYLRHYPEIQVDVNGKKRNAWVFEFRIHAEINSAPSKFSPQEFCPLLEAWKRDFVIDDTIISVPPIATEYSIDPIVVELTRIRLCNYTPRDFEHVLKNLLEQSGCRDVCVTKYSQDGGVDVNAYVGKALWPIENTLIQLQAKKWMHTVGRKEVAELRGSLHPHAIGSIVTTSFFSKSAIGEAYEENKRPINLIDGFQLAHTIQRMKLALP